MKLVVGLGNPGRKYENTRHNVGFEVLAKLAQLHSAGPVVKRFQGELVDYAGSGEKVVMLSPTTFMNRSGQSVRAAVDFYKLECSQILVVCDDFNLPMGRLRFRGKGSAGGQNGLADVIRHLGTDEICRLRIGIGPPPPQWDVADFVLSRFDRMERAEMDEIIARAARGVDDWVAEGVGYCMNHYNAAK